MNTKIDKKSYDKKSIISTIEKNFKINNKRNFWDKASVLHHAFNDASNPQYHKVNFDTLIPVYKKTLFALFNKMDFISSYHFNFRVDNYTCLSNSNYMSSHVHPSNSWMYKDWGSNVEEDDFYFYPAFLKHKIDPQTSKKKNRITIVLNITLEKDEYKISI